MLKGGLNSGQVAPHGVRITTNVIGKAVKLVYGLCKVSPDLIWYNDWKANGSPVNGRLWTVVGGAQQGKKKSSKKSHTSYYSAAIDMLLGHAPIAGVLTIWYNNQRIGCIIASASGFISGSSFSFTPVAGESIVTVTQTVPGSPYIITVSNFVSDGQTSQNNTGVYDRTLGKWLVSADPGSLPGPNQYTVDGSGNYTFDAAQSGHSVDIHYRKSGTGTAGTLAGIVAVTINEQIPTTTFDDYGAPGSVTMSGHWDRPLWNRGFAVPGRIDSGAYAARDPYAWSWDGINPTVSFPDSSLNGLPVTVYYAVPVINKSDGTFYSSSITPLALLNLEFESECGSGSEYVNHANQQDINAWCAGVGSVQFDLGSANAIPNIQMECIGAFTKWPNGDMDVADLVSDIVMSGPVLPGLLAHGANCNSYNNGGYISPSFPPGNGLLIGDLGDAAGGSPLVYRPVVPVAIEDMHSWCVANAIHVALDQDTQRTAKDLLDELLCVGNSAPVYIGDTLHAIPYDEVSNVGNGAIYTAPTSSGPLIDLDDKDFVSDGKTPPVTLTRKRRASCDNVASIEFVDRDLEYGTNVVSSQDAMSLALYGPRKGGTLDSAQIGLKPESGSKRLNSITDSSVAQQISDVLARRSAAGPNVYEFELKAECFWVTAMDLVTAIDSRLGARVAMRMIDVKETSKRTYKCQAEKFIYGLNHPQVRNAASGSGTLVQGGGDPGVVNAPIMFQPTPALAGDADELWILVSGEDPNYGGCVAYASIDGGTSYDPIGQCPPAVTGVLTADFPETSPATDPDTTSTLAVDLTECGGSLTSWSQQEADANLNPCYVAIESGSPLAATGYEIVCPTVVTLTSSYHYSMGTYIRRAVKQTTYADHQSGWRFGVVDSATLKVPVDPYWIGKTVLFKFAAFNKMGGQSNNLADCIAYSYTFYEQDWYVFAVNGN